jgi:ATP-dependent Clp protease ATP-binding subunit ClpB
MFRPLVKTEIKGIINIQLEELKRLWLKNGIDLQFTDYTLDYLADNGYDPQFGARPLKACAEIVNQLSKKILGGDIDRSSPVIVDVFDGTVFRDMKKTAGEFVTYMVLIVN